MKLQIREILDRKISDVLVRRQVVRCASDNSVAEAITLIRKNRVGSIVVTNGLQVLGIFTERDFLEKIALEEKDPFKAKIETYMTKDPVTVGRHESLGEVLKKMRKGKFRHIVIVDGYKNLENVASLREIMDYIVNAAGDVLDLGPLSFEKDVA